MRIRHPLFESPRVIDGFVSPEDCESMLSHLSYTFWWPSTVTTADRHGTRIFQSEHRTSETTDEAWFPPSVVGRLKTVNRRLATFIPDFEARREKWQATSYKKGGKFDYHFDSGSWASDPAGERQYTVMIILRPPTRGGSTHFLLQDIDIEPVAGRLVLWSNLKRNGRRCEYALHAGLPVLRGQKWILVTWVRQRRIN